MKIGSRWAINLGSPRHGTNLPGNLAACLDFRLPQVEGTLQVEPELGGGVKVARQPQCSVRRHGSSLAHDIVDPWCRHMQFHCQGVGAHAQRDKEFFPEDLAWVNRSHFVGSHVISFNGNQRFQHSPGLRQSIRSTLAIGR